MRLSAALALVLLIASVAHATPLYRVESVQESGDVVRVFAVADLAPVEAVVRERAHEAVERSAPALLRPRDLGAYRLRDARVEVQAIRFAQGGSANEVSIEVDTQLTAEREDRSIVLRDYLPTVLYRARGRVEVASARLVVAARVAIDDGRSVVLRVIGQRLVVSEPFALDLDLDGRLLHTHVQPIPDHPSIAGLVPEAAAVRSIADHALHFVVRFRRAP